MQRNPHRLLALAALGGALGVGGATATAAASSAATAPTHGTVHVWVAPSKGAVEQILLAGAIADHGTATTIDKNGTVDKNGEYVKVALSHGTFEVDAVAFNRKLDKLRPKVNRANCSAWATGSGDVTVQGGTGAYAGISGTITMTTSFAAILPRYTSGAKQGQCNQNGTPVAQFQGTLEGSGHVSL